MRRSRRGFDKAVRGELEGVFRLSEKKPMGGGDRTKGEFLEELRDLRLRVSELEGQEETHLERVRDLEAL